MRNVQKITRTIVTLACVSFGPCVQAAGFRCDQATTAVEKLVCADPQLSTLDAQINEAYQAAISNPDHRAEVTTAQIRWLALRDACVAAACIRQAYLSRLRALQPALDEQTSTRFLVQSIHDGDRERVQDLLAAGVDVNAPYEDGAPIRGTTPPTPLHLAAVNDHPAIIELLIAHGAGIEAPGNMGTPLDLAAYYGKLEAVKILLSHGAEVNRGGMSPALNAAARNGHLDVAALLLAQGAIVNPRAHSGSPSALFVAANARHLDFVELLLANGADVNYGIDDGGAALVAAIESGDRRILELLISKGAMVSIANAVISPQGMTPLHVAAHAGNLAACEILISKDVDIDAVDANGATPLHWAAARGDLAVVNFLLEHHASVNARNNAGLAPVDLARKSGNPAVVASIEHSAT
jgi:ankyrin repeat protein/uncharacterized protein YecT (DUF1311 family)